MVDVNIKLKAQGSEEVKRGISSVDKAVADLRAEILRLDGTADSNLLDFRMDVAQKEIADTIKDAAKLRQELEKPIEVNIQTNSVRGALFDKDQVKGAKDAFGDASTGLSAIGSGVGAFSSTFGTSLQDLGDVVGAAEGLPVLISGVTQLGLAAAPIGAVTAAAAAGFVLLNKELDKQTKLINQLAEDERSRVDAQIQTRNDLRTLTEQDARLQLEDLQFQIQANQQGRDMLVQQFSANIGTITGFGDAVTTSLSGLGSALGVNVGQIGAAKDALKLWNEELATTQAEIDRLTNDVLPALERRASSQAIVDALLEEEQSRARVAEIIRTGTAEQVKDRLASIDIEQQSAEEAKRQADERIKLFYAEKQAQIDLYNAYIQRGGAEAQVGQDRLNLLLEEIKPFEQASQQLGDALSSLATEQQALTDTALPLLEAREREAELIKRQTEAIKAANDAIQDTIKKQTDASKSLRTVSAEINKLSADRDAVQERKAEETAIKNQRDAQLRELDTRYAGIRAAEKSAQQQAKLASIETERTAKITDVNKKFYTDSLKLVTDFRKQEEQEQRRANLEKIQLLRQGELDLREASQNNDIASFVNISNRLNNDLLTQSENAGLGRDERAAGLKDALDNAALAREQEVQNVIQTYQQKIAVETQAQQQSLTAENRYQQEKQALQERWRQEDIARQAQHEQATFNLKMQFLQAEQQAIQNQLNIFRQQLFTQVQTLAAQPNRNAGQDVFRQGRYITANATGGIYPGNHPQLVLIGDTPLPEAIVPIRNSNGFENDARRMGLGGSSPVVVNFNGAISGVSKDDLTQIRTEVIQAVKLAKTGVA